MTLYPVEDPDVFWHLKTGEWIWQHKQLPDKDPFSFTVTQSFSKDLTGSNAILKGYWLSQLTIYGFYNVFGIYGIIFFRFLVYLGLMSLMYFWMRQKGVNQILVFFFLIPSFLVIQQFGGDRPNTFSYLIAASFFYIVNEHVKQGKKTSLFLPILMWVWSFMHGGFLLGEVILGIYLLIELYAALRGCVSWKSQAFKTSILLLSMAVPFTHPTSWCAVMRLIEINGSLYSRSVLENVGPFAFVKMGNYGFLVLMGFLLFSILVVIRKFSAEQIMSAVFTLALSFLSVRYIPFFILMMGPLAASGWATRPTFNIYEAGNKRLRYLMYATVIISLIFVGRAAYKNSIFLTDPISSNYPNDAVEFIKNEKPRGSIFNEYGWGGYLIYRLYPEKQVFIDGRGLSLAIFDKYVEVMKSSLQFGGESKPRWREVFDEHKIDIVLMPVCNNSGNKFLLLNKRLIDDPEWALVFIGNKDRNLLFLRKGAGNDEIVKKYEIRKELVYEKALQILVDEQKAQKKWRRYLESGLISTYLGKYDNAALYFDKAIERNRELKSTAIYKGLERIRRKELPAFNDKELEEIQSL